MTVAARTPLGQIARLFLRLGTTAFGGPAAHIAMMEDEVVARRRETQRKGREAAFKAALVGLDSLSRASVSSCLPPSS